MYHKVLINQKETLNLGKEERQPWITWTRWYFNVCLTISPAGN